MHRRDAMTPAGRHTVKLHGIVVGYSELEDGDPELGRARGLFRPGVGYDLVQPVFQLYVEAVPVPGGDVADQAKLDRYHKSRDALGLSLEDDTGRAVSTSALHISDYSQRAGGRLELEALITDHAYWKRRQRAG
jgi:hypothetical protein